ncbi:hypothetical protein MUN88_19120 [Gracilibacillus caseinilyticus]|uniref:Uncharacterized protein n=1 Tax=Gracilibacillus caseinilyticus TaxID=2932256 RepID=A0ABY4F121_9BACI|nr:hypothetical protein [Gracilibacillus caseinilyticus]UOQ48131.1 hypothetical protein MUN88_19120 [Gracilibacillus caseinilyticus]
MNDKREINIKPQSYNETLKARQEQPKGDNPNKGYQGGRSPGITRIDIPQKKRGNAEHGEEETE